MTEVRVRFAPSPTGFLHVGGARTAIFNWLFARNQKGKFLLRIEDTDAERSKSELSDQIIRSMNWLGMISDEAIVYQSDRIERYREVVKELVANGKAYYCFETSDELEVKRKEASAKKIPYKYDRASLNLDKATIEKYLADKKEHTVRFFIPEGETIVDDMVHEETKFNNNELDDFVILRSDGSPVYQIAVVVDDHDMKISHVIRGDDHLSNTPKQILLYEALSWELPKFAHLPMILDEAKKKLSKRRNPVSCEEYKDKGYLPEAMFNFLTLLGFAPKDNKEILSRDELIKEFTFDRVNKSSSVFDVKKLNWLNSEYIKNTDEKLIAELIKEKLVVMSGVTPDKNVSGEPDTAGKKLLTPQARELSDEYVIQVVRLMKERVSTINDFVEFGKYFFEDPSSYDEKGLVKYSNEETKQLLKEYAELLNSISSNVSSSGVERQFTAKNIEEQLRTFAESKGVKAGAIIHPLRLALTGITISPGIFELMVVLGKEKVIKRIKNLTDKANL